MIGNTSKTDQRVLNAQHEQLEVGLYITGAYWFTASTSFANPAVTLARAFTNTFAGIRPVDAQGFIGAQLLGAFTATILLAGLYHRSLPRRRALCFHTSVTRITIQVLLEKEYDLDVSYADHRALGFCPRSGV
jgi:glycerol uptake facilitator-like aquaporin